MAQYSYSIRDFSDEYGRVTISVEEPSEAELDWETVINANEGTFRTALNGVILGNVARHHVLVSEELVDDSRPASALAQREFAMRVFVSGVTTSEKRNFTIPTVDIGSLTITPGTDLVELADGGPMAALVTAIESVYFINYPDGSDEQVTVDRAVIVGRNS